MINKLFRRGVFQKLLLSVVLLIIWFFLRRVFRERIGAFGCFDDCFNIIGGWFVLQGRQLFSEIFFNHQPLMAYISSGIQYFYESDTPYLLIFNHRMIFIWYTLLWGIFFTWRFGLFGSIYWIFWELTKAYVFGDRFLAESFIVYPLSYMTVLLFGLTNRHPDTYAIGKWNSLEYMFISVLTWFVVFMREPFIPLVLLIFIFLLFTCPSRKIIIASLIVFGLLSVVTIFSHTIMEYYFNVIFVNQSIIPGVVTTQTIVSMFMTLSTIVFYPFMQFFFGEVSIIRYITIILSLLLIVGLVFLIVKKEWKVCIFILTILMLSNLRFENPGTMYYAAFHTMIWMSELLCIVIMLMNLFWMNNKRILFSISMVGLSLVFLISLFHPQSIFKEKVDRTAEFTTNFAQVIVPGEIISLLSNHTTDTLFVEERDDFIYWTAKTLPAYRYSWYTSIMPNFEKYVKAREEMFQKSPPTFYFGLCNDTTSDPARRLGEFKSLYRELFASNGMSTCIYIRNDKVALIEDEKWNLLVKYNLIKPDM